MIGPGDAGDILIGQLAMNTIEHRAHLAGVDEKNFAAAVTESAVLPIPGDEP